MGGTPSPRVAESRQTPSRPLVSSGARVVRYGMFAGSVGEPPGDCRRNHYTHRDRPPFEARFSEEFCMSARFGFVVSLAFLVSTAAGGIAAETKPAGDKSPAAKSFNGGCGQFVGHKGRSRRPLGRIRFQRFGRWRGQIEIRPLRHRHQRLQEHSRPRAPFSQGRQRVGGILARHAQSRFHRRHLDRPRHRPGASAGWDELGATAKTASGNSAKSTSGFKSSAAMSASPRPREAPRSGRSGSPIPTASCSACRSFRSLPVAATSSI